MIFVTMTPCFYAILSELMLLQELEEVLHLDAAILWHVRAVQHIAHSIEAELGPDRVWSQVACDLRIVWSAQLSETGHCVALSHLESNDWAACHVLDDGQVLWDHTLVDVVEFLNYWP